MQYQKLIKKHYKEEAEKNKFSLESTMADLNTRRLEIENITTLLKDGAKCLEVGCGNGSASIEISKIKKLDLLAIDFSPEMIAIAKKQPINKVKGKVSFQEADVLDLKYKNIFDFVFTERCIINLLDLKDQKRALEKMADALKPGGYIILLEAFNDGLLELNSSREDLGLEPISPAFHNLYLDKKLVINYLEGKSLKFIEEKNFLSSYFFGSRVVYPALVKVGKKDVRYNSAFAKYFSFLPPVGNYSQIKILIFEK